MNVFVSPAEGRVTSRWGARPPLNYHYGIDIAPPVPGTRNWPVYAAYAGTVRAEAVSDDKRGNPITGTWNTGSYMLIDGERGSEWYGHMDKHYVKAGDRVEAGQSIGVMGERGNVTGVHLHFESWDGFTRSPHDPMIDFKLHGVKPGSKPVVAKKGVAVEINVKSLAREVWRYRSTHIDLDAWGILRNMFKKVAEIGERLDRIEAMLNEDRKVDR